MPALLVLCKLPGCLDTARNGTFRCGVTYVCLLLGGSVCSTVLSAIDRDKASHSIARTGATEHSKGTASRITARKRRHGSQQGQCVTEYSKETASQSTARTRRHTIPLVSQSCWNFILWAAPDCRHFWAECKIMFVGRPAGNWALGAALLYMSRNCRCI